MKRLGAAITGWCLGSAVTSAVFIAMIRRMEPVAPPSTPGVVVCTDCPEDCPPQTSDEVRADVYDALLHVQAFEMTNTTAPDTFHEMREDQERRLAAMMTWARAFQRCGR